MKFTNCLFWLKSNSNGVSFLKQNPQCPFKEGSARVCLMVCCNHYIRTMLYNVSETGYCLSKVSKHDKVYCIIGWLSNFLGFCSPLLPSWQYVSACVQIRNTWIKDYCTTSKVLAKWFLLEVYQSFFEYLMAESASQYGKRWIVTRYATTII